MGRRKSLKPENTEELRQRQNRRHSCSSPRNDDRRCNSEDSDGRNRQERLSRAPSNKNLYSSGPMPSESFNRTSRVGENPKNGYNGFHLPSGDAPYLEPLPTPTRGCVPLVNSNASSSNGIAPSGYVGSAGGGNPMMRKGNNGRPVMTNASSGDTSNAPLTRRTSQIRFGPDEAALSPPPPLMPYQPNMRYPIPDNGPTNMNAPGYPQPLPSPMRRQQQQLGIDFVQMMQCFRRLPQLPYVMTPHGMLAPPPFPFPYPDLMQLHQLQQQMMMSPRGRPAGLTSPWQPPPPFFPAPHPQHAPSPSVGTQRPFYGPQGNSVSNNVSNNNHNVGANAAAAPISPPSVSAGGAAASTGLGPPLPRTTSILNRVSSFKKNSTVASGSTKTPDAAQDNTNSGAPPPTTPPSSGGILNRVSSFKNAGGPSSSSSSSPPVPSTAHSAASPVPLQHPAAAPRTQSEPPTMSILRRKSFFATSAAAVPEPEFTAEEREAVLKEKLAQREIERQRLEEEHWAREKAMDRLVEESRKKMREAQACEEPTAMRSAEPIAPPTPPSPTAQTKCGWENKSNSPPQNVSRASSYSFACMEVTQSGRSGSQPPLPGSQKQQPQQQPQQQWPQSPPKPNLHHASTDLNSGGCYAKSETSGSLMTANELNGTKKEAKRAINLTPPVEEVRRPPQQQPLHRCPALVLYEIPFRCRRTTNEKGEDVIDDANFPIRVHRKSLRATDAATKQTSVYPHDEFVIHRKGSANVESKLLDKVKEVVLAGYTASVLSLDTQGLAKPTSAFDSAAWMAKQRLVLNVVNSVEKMQTIYAKGGGIGSSNSSIEVALSIALVKKVSAAKAAEWNITDPSTRQRTFEVVDLLQPEPVVVPFRMYTSVLFGNRLDNVQYKPVPTEADFNTVMASAQSSANIVLGRLADASAMEPDNAELTAEKDFIFEVLTCVVRHHKAGSVSLMDQLKESASDVFARSKAEEIISSDDEDDDARVLDSFISHNGPSSCSDIIMSCLTCIGVRQNADLWEAVLEHKEEMAPSALFNTAFGGPAYTIILASIDPTKQESAQTLSTQVSMAAKLHRRPTNGSARRLIQSSKYRAGAAQMQLERPVRPTGAEQRELKAIVRRSAATLDGIQKALAADR